MTISPLAIAEIFKSGKKKKKKCGLTKKVTLNSSCGWAGSAPDVRFAPQQDHTEQITQQIGDISIAGINLANAPGLDIDQIDDDGDEEGFRDRLLISGEEDAPDIEDSTCFTFHLEDGSRKIDVWSGFLCHSVLFVEIPIEDLPPGTKEGFTCLLEYAEEELAAETMFLCISKDSQHSAQQIRTFMYLGFEMAHPDRCTDLPKNDNYIYMGYTFD